jgi:hypothetical protein
MAAVRENACLRQFSARKRAYGNCSWGRMHMAFVHEGPFLWQLFVKAHADGNRLWGHIFMATVRGGAYILAVVCGGKFFSVILLAFLLACP